MIYKIGLKIDLPNIILKYIFILELTENRKFLEKMKKQN